MYVVLPSLSEYDCNNFRFESNRNKEFMQTWVNWLCKYCGPKTNSDSEATFKQMNFFALDKKISKHRGICKLTTSIFWAPLFFSFVWTDVAGFIFYIFSECMKSNPSQYVGCVCCNKQLSMCIRHNDVGYSLADALI